jgi:hypothetical protein
MRCKEGQALCAAQVEIGADVSKWTWPLQQITRGRPQAQLTHIRRALKEHDEGCFQCSEGAAMDYETDNQE